MDFEVLIIGGGIQGVGLLHDLASRRIEGVHLLEERSLSIGTSSRSTKLLHGGLRYLEHISQWRLVHEALNERRLLLQLLQDVVRPLPFVLPVFEGDRPPWMIDVGLKLYDFLAGDSGLPSAKRMSKTEMERLAPYLNCAKGDALLKGAFLFYDGQMLDDVIVRLAAQASCRLGASYEEGVRVEQVVKRYGGNSRSGEGFLVETSKGGLRQSLTAKVVVLATGAWNNWNLMRWGITPSVPCILNAGSHLVFAKDAVAADPASCAASLIQHHDGRVLFFIPWFGRWLFGTTEASFRGDPRNIKASEEEKKYLFDIAQAHFNLREPLQNLEEVFCGVRTMPMRAQKNSSRKLTESERADPFASEFYLEATPKHLARLSRESVISEDLENLFAIYGGKYTTYRAQSESLGRRIKDVLGKGTHSTTHTRDAWFLDEIRATRPELFKSSKSLRSA